MGKGEVLEESQDGKIRVNFENVGVKVLISTSAKLECIEGTAPIPFRIDMQRLESQCNRFHEALEHNRKGSDDGGIALKVLEDVKCLGMPAATDRKDLLKWCYTDGPLYQAGVALAREICETIYGRVLPKPDASKRPR